MSLIMNHFDIPGPGIIFIPYSKAYILYPTTFQWRISIQQICLFCIVAGRGVVARRTILKGTCVLHYVGKRREEEPPPDMDDSYIYEMHLGRRKTIW